MKSRLTLTIDPLVSHRARAVARARGQSLSSLVENLLEREAGGIATDKAEATFSRRWAGKVRVAEKMDSRSVKLKEKYQL